MKNNLLKETLITTVSLAFILTASGQTKPESHKIQLSLQSGLIIPSTTLNLNNGWNISGNLYIPLWRMDNGGIFQTNIGINGGFSYFNLSNSSNENTLPDGFQIVGQSSPPEIKAENRKQNRSGVSGETGLQANFSVGKITFSPILNVGYASVKGSEHNILQESKINDENHEFTLYREKNDDTKGIVMIPKFRLSYFPGKIGVFTEVAYNMGGNMKKSEYTFKPNGDPIRGDYYDLKQIDAGQLELTSESNEKLRFISLNFGVSLPLFKRNDYSPNSIIAGSPNFNTTRSNRDNRLIVDPNDQTNPDSIQPSKITKAQDFNTTRNNRERRLKTNPTNQPNQDSIQPSKVTKAQDFNTTRSNRDNRFSSSPNDNIQTRNTIKMQPTNNGLNLIFPKNDGFDINLKKRSISRFVKSKEVKNTQKINISNAILQLIDSENRPELTPYSLKIKDNVLEFPENLPDGDYVLSFTVKKNVTSEVSVGMQCTSGVIKTRHETAKNSVSNIR